MNSTVDTTTTRRPRVIIIGAGFGGLSAAKKLMKQAVDITIIDRRNHHLFQPLLYQVATAILSPADIAVPIRSVLTAGAQRNVHVLLDEVVSVDLERRCVVTRDSGEQFYDYLIMAPGSQYNYFGHDAEWAELAPSLKTLEDATEMRRRVLLAFERAESAVDKATQEALLTFIVIGGGPTGVELAGALAELAKASLVRDFARIDPRKARIILVEAGPALLMQFTDRQGRFTRKALEKLGVEVRLQQPVQDITEHGAIVAGEFIAAANVFWCAGVKASPLVAQLGLPAARNGAVVVNNDSSIPGHPEVFVVGDASSITTDKQGTLPALAPVAKQQGRYAASVIAARLNNWPMPKPFSYFDWGTMATIGRFAAIGKFGRVHLHGRIAWLLWSAVHIMYLVGFRNRVVVLVNWLWAFVTYGKGARLITGSTELENMPKIKTSPAE